MNPSANIREQEKSKLTNQADRGIIDALKGD
jgi:hypothetical protein